MNKWLACLLVPWILGAGLPCTMLGKSFNGLFTPEFVRGEEAPFIPVSASATLIIGARIRGELQLRELGSYRLEGIASGALLDLRLFPNDGSRAGRAIGKWADSEMDLELSFTDASGELQSRGKLQLEAYAEWRATSALKVGRDLKDPSLRSWHKPGYDDSRWELVELPDDNSFGKKHPYERLYRSRFIRADPKEAVKVTVSPDHPVDGNLTRDRSRESGLLQRRRHLDLPERTSVGSLGRLGKGRRLRQ